MSPPVNLRAREAHPTAAPILRPDQEGWATDCLVDRRMARGRNQTNGIGTSRVVGLPAGPLQLARRRVLRRPTSALTTAILGTALTASTLSAQTYPPAAEPPGVSPMAAARGVRHLLRNGWDYISYQEYERALAYFREAETRKFELSEPELLSLRQGIARAQQGMREATNASTSSYARSGNRRPGAFALARPAQGANAGPTTPEPIQLASGESGAGAPVTAGGTN